MRVAFGLSIANAGDPRNDRIISQENHATLSTRLALLELAHRQRFSPTTFDAVARIAAADHPPLISAQALQRGARILATLLAGLGVVFFIAANWVTRSPLPMFVGLETLVLAACIGAARLARLRVPLVLLGFLATGALLAFFGQHYQSSADPWQLFAIWAGLLAPLALACRSDVIWSAWTVVAMTALTTWLNGFRAGFGIHDHGVQWTAMGIALFLSAVLSRPLRRLTGAGDWSLNLAVLFAAILVGGCGLSGLFDRGLASYGVALVVLSCAALYFSQVGAFDIRALTVCALGIDVLLIGGSVKIAFTTDSLGGILFMVGVTILVTMYVTATCIMGLHRSHIARGGAS